MLRKHDLILFDLDGTLSDPIEGVSRSINYALAHFGYEPRPLCELAKYVGPSLDRTFKALLGQDIDSRELVAKYRDRYGDIGYAENVLYPGIIEALVAIDTAQIPMAICTAKRQDFAEKILKMFGLNPYFQFINGGEVGISKSQQIASLLAQGKVSESTVMIGDRAVDLIAAHQNGLSAGGVLWGYGSLAELAQENPRYFFNTPNELVQFAEHIN